jgi:hypothetical protein
MELNQILCRNWIARLGRQTRALVAVALILGCAVAQAQENGVPNTFEDGQPISAQEMNDNFDSLHERIKTLEASVASLLDTNSTSSGAGGDGVSSGGSSGEPATPVGIIPMPYVVNNSLSSLTGSNEAGVSIASNPSLQDANGVILKLLGTGSIDLDQTFLVLDASDGNTLVSEGVPGQRITVRFKSDLSGVVSYNHDFSSYFYYESSDCTGDAKVDVNILQTTAGVWLVDGITYRLPMGAEVSNMTAASKRLKSASAGSTAACETTNEFLTFAGSLVAYDPSPIKALIAEPLRVVVP